MLNQVTLIGIVREEPEFKEISASSNYYTFDVDTDRAWKDARGVRKHEVDRVHVIAWNKRWIGDAIRSGDKVMVIGRIQEHEVKDPVSGILYPAYEVVASEVQNVTRYGRSSGPPPRGTAVADDN